MASKVFSFLTIIVLVAYVNAMAIEKLSENSSVNDHREITEDSNTSKPVIIGVGEEDRAKNVKSALVEKRSVKEDDVKLIPDNYIDEEKSDDLETAAGTNVLRPLFVYRQQLAYRERVRKAGRRAAPNV